MKLFIGLVASLLLVQALALPAPEQPIQEEQQGQEFKARNTQFQDDLFFQFARFQTFYDLFTERMTHYRTNHVQLVREIGMPMMEVFAFDIDFVRESKANVDEQVRLALDRLGGSPNACLEEVLGLLDANSARLGTEFNACARRANNTISTGLADIFYPTFDEIQRSASAVPLFTIGALSRGNAFEDSQEIIDYLDAQFRAIDLQWKTAASQLFRWETNRFSVEGRFYIEQIRDCLGDPIENYRNTNTVNMYRIVDECAPTQRTA